jgi:hypothetical protein
MLMSNVKPDLRKCSRCHSTCSLEHFEINRKGEFYKLCNTCRVKKKPILSEEQCINNNSSFQTKSYGFTEFIMNRGIEFESELIKYILGLYGH